AFIRPTLSNLQDSWHLLQEYVNQARIEMFASLFPDISHSLVQRPGFFMRPLRRQRIEDISQRHDTAYQRNPLSCQSAWIATAIPAFVMRQRNIVGHAQQAVGVNADDARTDNGVFPHDYPVVWRQLAGFLEDAVGNPYLPYVMHGGCVEQVFHHRFIKAGRAGYDTGVMAHAEHMQAGLIVFIFSCHPQPLYQLQTAPL